MGRVEVETLLYFGVRSQKDVQASNSEEKHVRDGHIVLAPDHCMGNIADRESLM